MILGWFAAVSRMVAITDRCPGANNTERGTGALTPSAFSTVLHRALCIVVFRD